MLEYTALWLTGLLALLAVLIYKQQKNSKSSEIPGPKRANKIEGNFPDIARCGSLHQFLLDLHHKYGPIASFWWGPKRTVSLASPKLFKHQMKLFDRPGELFKIFQPLLGAESVSFAVGDDGRRRNKSIAACFSLDNLGQYYSKVQKHVDELVSKWCTLASGEHIALTEQMMKFMAKASLECHFGSYFKDDKIVDNIWQSSLYCWNETQKQLRGDFADDDDTKKKAFDQHKDIVLGVIRDAWRHRLENPGVEGEHIVIDAVSEQDMSERKKFDDLTNIIFASVHTTGMTNTWALYFLASHPDLQEKAYQEIKEVLGENKMDPGTYMKLVYLHQVLMETIRWTSMVPMAARNNYTEIEVAGYTIPAGTPVIQALGVVGHDSQIFPEPERFDPERFNPDNSKKLPVLAFEPFGFAGKRKCPGYRFADFQATIVLAELLKTFRISLVEGQVVTPVYGLVTEPTEEIWIKIEPRK